MADKSIRAQSQQVAALSVNWPMFDALMDGTQTMRAGGKKWLPAFPAEPDDVYKARLSSAVLHPAFKRTVLVNAARPFSRALAFDEATPPKVIDWTADIDLQGTPLVAFSVQLMTACLSKGLIGVMVEHPQAGNVRTQAEERAAGLRPYLTQYASDCILGWKTKQAPGGQVLSQLRLLEHVEVPKGAYQTQMIEQVRVLEPSKWAVYRENAKNPEKWDRVESGRTSLPVVPFVFFYGIRHGFGIGISPLSDLAFQNVEHWQSSSDQQTILHAARVPILFAKQFGLGVEGSGSALIVGAGAVASSENENADLTYVEHSGAAVEAGRNSLIDLQDRMRSTGAELISLQPAYTTATQVSADSNATKCLLQQIVENFEESLSSCLNLMARYQKLDETAKVVIYKDFGIAADTNGPTQLSGAARVGAVSKQTLFEELQRRDVLAGDRTWEEEEKRLKAEAPPDGEGANIESN